ncbi:CarD family transcriptional regulator [Gracilibacillus halotolerans]|uniref:CarD family transcriptional regulator n=1 Tax=Gracilibacillus halotolerans TaxID=74386 RepID=A0A841RRF4_9BACI|nr:CarD family transcriptional regulator [Gracilibacillus halotolerans]MBB6514402.1 CarD family transcriptional regulator [Gracilibacillus halotolerans]
MFNIGDLIIYSSHGICKIDDIQEKTISGVTRQYYILHPVASENHLTISAPVNNDQVIIKGLMNKEEALKVLETFDEEGIDWVDNANRRFNEFSGIVNKGNNKDIAQVANTLMRRRIELDKEEKRLYQKDEKLLEDIQQILFHEIALALDMTYESVDAMVNNQIEGKIANLPS